MLQLLYMKKVAPLFLIVLLFPSLAKCGGSFNKRITRDFTADQVNSISLKHYSSDSKNEESINTDKDYEIFRIYDCFREEVVNSVSLLAYETSLDFCIETYEIEFTLKDLTTSLIKYYVYDHTKGTVVYEDGLAYSFYGNAKYETFTYLKEYFNSNKELYSIYINGDEDAFIDQNFKNNSYLYDEIVTFEIRPFMDVSTYIYINNELLKGTPSSNSSNTIYAFKMPKHDVVIHVTHDEFYLDHEYKFKDIFPKFSDEFIASIKEISTMQSYIGTQKLEKDSVQYSKSPTDINNISSLFNESFVKATANDIDGGTSFEYCFINDDYEFKVLFLNGLLVYQNFASYQLFKPVNESVESLIIKDPYLVLSKFSSTLINSYDIFTNDGKNTKYGSFSYLYDIQFKESATSISIDKCKYYIDILFGKLYIYDNLTFVFNDVTYVIEKGSDFSKIR